MRQETIEKCKEALQLMKSSGITQQQACKKLGIGNFTLHKFKRDYKEPPSTPPTKQSELSAPDKKKEATNKENLELVNRRLQLENTMLKRENRIFKNFAREMLIDKDSCF